MAAGRCPPGTPPEAQQLLEPLCLWFPRLLAPCAPMQPAERQAYCQELLIKQDDAWQAVIQGS